MHKALDHLNIQTIAIHYDDALQKELEAHSIDLCFLATHGVPGEDGKLQGYLKVFDAFILVLQWQEVPWP